MRVTWEEPIAYDDTAYVEKMFNTHNSGDFFYIGSTGVEYVFKDLAGNTEECSFEVQITFGEKNKRYLRVNQLLRFIQS